MDNEISWTSNSIHEEIKLSISIFSDIISVIQVFYKQETASRQGGPVQASTSTGVGSGGHGAPCDPDGHGFVHVRRRTRWPGPQVVEQDVNGP